MNSNISLPKVVEASLLEVNEHVDQPLSGLGPTKVHVLLLLLLWRHFHHGFHLELTAGRHHQRQKEGAN